MFDMYEPWNQPRKKKTKKKTRQVYRQQPQGLSLKEAYGGAKKTYKGAKVVYKGAKKIFKKTKTIYNKNANPRLTTLKEKYRGTIYPKKWGDD